jgi:hypothetical protein
MNILYVNNVIQIFSATSLNKLDNHLNEINNNISKNQLAKRSKAISKNPTMISCVNDGCLEESKAQCLPCTKYYSYEHIQLCFQIHPNEI